MKTRSIATAGMISDTSLYNVDGACVVGGAAPIPVGTAVRVTEAQPIDGHKVVINTGQAAGTAYGVVVKSGYETPDGTARAKEAVNVLTHGRIWMVVGALTQAQAVFGAPVKVNVSGQVDNAGVGTTGWKFAGGYVAAADGNPALVEVQVLQSSTPPAPAA